MRINLIFNSFRGVVYTFWQILFKTFVCKFVFNFECTCIHTSKFSCIIIVDMCVRSYIPMLHKQNWQTSFYLIYSRISITVVLINPLVLTY